MNADEVRTLAALLRKLAAEGLGTPHLPKEVFAALRGVVAQPTVELLVTSTGSDVLLTERHDQHWHGVHVPGGFVGVGESMQATCERIAQRELGAGATLERIVGHYVWLEHPYASPLSLLCLCRLDRAPAEGKFFEMASLPDDLLREHRELLERFWPA
jgi:ADP-ribose pyrophosphatase YjhB (NUDIX family)